MKGNEALAEAAIAAGCRHYFGYPITPQTEMGAYLAERSTPEVGGVFLQAESEIAAIHMVYGASCAGKRAMTSSSRPRHLAQKRGVILPWGATCRAGGQCPARGPGTRRHSTRTGGLLSGDARRRTRGFSQYRARARECAGRSSLTLRGFDLADRYRT